MAKLTVNEASGDFTHVLVLTAQDIIESGNSQTIWGSIPVGGAVDVACAVESVAITGATDLTLEVGTGTDDDTLIDSFDVDGTDGTPKYNTGTSFVQASGNTTIAGGAEPVGEAAAAQNLIYKIGGTTANTTAGEIIIAVRVFDPLRFSRG
jgi:hypothetical protein